MITNRVSLDANTWQCYVLGVVIAKTEFIDSLSSELLQPLIGVDSHRVVMFVRLITETEHLEKDEIEARITLLNSKQQDMNVGSCCNKQVIIDRL